MVKSQFKRIGSLNLSFIDFGVVDSHWLWIQYLCIIINIFYRCLIKLSFNKLQMLGQELFILILWYPWPSCYQLILQLSNIVFKYFCSHPLLSLSYIFNIIIWYAWSLFSDVSQIYLFLKSLFFLEKLIVKDSFAELFSFINFDLFLFQF